MFRMHEDHVNAEDGRSDDVDDERTPAFLKDFKKWACAEVKRNVSEKLLFAINIVSTMS